MQGVLLLLPDFGLILLGWVLYRVLDACDPFWSGLEKLVYFVLFPALLFNALARTPIDFGAAAPLFVSGSVAVGCGIVFGLLARPLFGQDDSEFASRFQCAFLFNSYIGLAVLGKLHGAAGISAALLVPSSLGLRGVCFDTAVLFGALPAATSAYIRAVRMGGDGPGVASPG